MTNEEINRAIAEKVMGWILVSTRVCDHWEDEKGVHRGLYSDWYPTERIDHAWQVVEKLKTKYKVMVGTMWEKEEDWWCELDDGQKIYANADTAPLAICLAALEAVKEE